MTKFESLQQYLGDAGLFVPSDIMTTVREEFGSELEKVTAEQMVIMLAGYMLSVRPYDGEFDHDMRDAVALGKLMAKVCSYSLGGIEIARQMARLLREQPSICIPVLEDDEEEEQGNGQG